ncbi:MAG: putative colanic acid biosynthesis acetyltransferase [Phycisphaerae bacterium]|nr:putative colanic acid biosynthesis acetyltransferase [Phycisphaerae bacterium]|tara:strand:+ start:598 stop:1188 length:591 start_codon:yes stop_codon:yes gene_type:complete
MTEHSPSHEMLTSPHSLRNKLARLAWGVVYVVLFRYSPRSFHSWRYVLLRIFGARIHRTSRIYPKARVWYPGNLVMGPYACLGDGADCYNVTTITIGEWATVSQFAYLCGATHDHEDVAFPLVPKPITIGRRAWIAADVFVAPGVTVGDGTVVGARSSVFKDLPEWQICAGTPAKPIKPRGLGPADFNMSDGSQGN